MRLIRCLQWLLAAITCSAMIAPTCAGARDVIVPMEATAPKYTLGAGDKVHVVVFGVLELTGDYSVTPGGLIPFPLVGEVKAAGKTVPELIDELHNKLSPNYVLDPKISIDVLNYRPFFILGEVTKPGPYPYQDAMTVQQAVATAEGYTYRANKGIVFLRHENEPKERPYSLKGPYPVDSPWRYDSHW